MKKCCCVILTTVFMLACVATTLASDFVLEFYIQVGASSVTPAKKLHCMLMDSNGKSVLDDRIEDEDICRIGVSLDDGMYSVIVEEPDLHYFGNVNIVVSSQSNSSMIFLLNNLGLNYLEGVHSCAENLACLTTGKCVCDDGCVCKLFNKKGTLQSVGQKSIAKITRTKSPKSLSTERVDGRCVTGQPTYSSYSYSNLCQGACDAGLGYGAACVQAYGGGGAWGLLGLLGVIGAIKCPKPISEEPVYK